MARITNFIYCMSANTSDIEANALGILSAITPEYVPGSFSFSVLCSIVDIENGTHNIAMKFLNPSGDILVNIVVLSSLRKSGFFLFKRLV
jgi:hypothetical protein